MKTVLPFNAHPTQIQAAQINEDSYRQALIASGAIQMEKDRKRIKELENALLPFAAEDECPDTGISIRDEDHAERCIPCQLILAARRVLNLK